MAGQGATVRQEELDWERVVDVETIIGEVPIWSTGDEALYWIDVRRPALHRDRLDGAGFETWLMPSLIGSYVVKPRKEGVLAALQDGLYDLDLRAGQLSKLLEPPYDPAFYRFNDGRCDRRGRFWVGASVLPGVKGRDGTSHFYRLDEGGWHAGIAGITIANGIAWSPDGRTMYLSDIPAKQILRFDYDPVSASVGSGSIFARTPGAGNPDGAAVDAEGGYWIAMIRDRRILRFLPDGTLDRDIRTPTLMPTMICFGGAGMDELFLTTSRFHYSDEASRERDSGAGAVYRCRPGVRGIPEPKLSNWKRNDGSLPLP